MHHRLHRRPFAGCEHFAQDRGMGGIDMLRQVKTHHVQRLLELVHTRRIRRFMKKRSVVNAVTARVRNILPSVVVQNRRMWIQSLTRRISPLRSAKLFAISVIFKRKNEFPGMDDRISTFGPVNESRISGRSSCVPHNPIRMAPSPP